ncbi:hypothetical protein SDC9_180833 [bioreactor metagenome]|uniref:Uncharacterized protein n=1 Tax=bioreactor metagenome TaxID=1076179 RepID=A0A645H2V0_9ZZZZ
MRYNNLAVEVHDLDIVVCPGDVAKAAQLLECYRCLGRDKANPNYRSAFFAEYRYMDLDVDVMSGMKIRYNDLWYELMVDESYPFVRKNGLSLMKLEDWYVLYYLMGRSDKVSLLQDHLISSDSLDRSRIVYLINQHWPIDLHRQLNFILQSNKAGIVDNRL